MNEEQLSQSFNQLSSEISPLTVSINLIIGFILSKIIAFHYKKYSSVLSCRKSFGNVIPYITLVTLLFITVYKSSLALSLGLVGALSIVRFRTPIKERRNLLIILINWCWFRSWGQYVYLNDNFFFHYILLMSISKKKYFC